MNHMLIEEMEWEREMFRLGADRYILEQERSDFEFTKVGKKFIQDLFDRLEVKIKEVQKEAAGSKGHKDRRGPLLLLDSEALTAITLKIVLTPPANAEAATSGAPLYFVCMKLGRFVETEINFRHWIHTSKEEAKEFANQKGLKKAPTSFAEKIIKEEGVSSRTLSRWKKCFKALTYYEWSDDILASVGEVLVNAAAAAIPEYLEIAERQTATQRTKRLVLTDFYHSEAHRIDAGARITQSIKKPMLIPPNEWELTE